MTGINPYKIRIPLDRVLVRLPKPTNDEITFSNGVKLFLDTTYEPGFHAMVNGTVVQVCENFTKESEWIPEIEVSPGDDVIIDYFQMLNHMGTLVHRYIEFPEDMYLEWDGGYFVFINYSELFAKADLTPLNGYVIYEGIYKKVGFGEYQKEILLENKGIAYRVGKMNKSYITEESDDVDIQEGDEFYFKKGMYRKLEYDVHATKNKNLYLVQRRYITAKCQDQQKT